MLLKNIKSLTPSELRDRTGRIASHSRKVDAVLIEYIAEIERRKAYIDWGFSSLYVFLTSELKLSGSSAYRRMQAAYAILQIPELKCEIEAGSLNLTQICAVQTAVKREQKVSGQFALAEKRELFQELKNKNSRETEKILDGKFELPASNIPTEKHKADESVELTIRLPKELFDKLARIKQLYSHSIADGNWISVIDKMTDDVLAKRDPLKKAKVDEERLDNREQRPIGSLVKRYVFQKDRTCQHRNKDGTVCGSRHQLEVDHIHPRFAGGGNEVKNLRILCRAHNRSRYLLGQ